LAELEQELTELPPEQRAELASFLLASLEPSDEGDIEAAWLAEAERRLEEFEAGRMEAIPAEQVLSEARGRLARRR
jgi:putative addiction module component (TIGR02574 family)